jgi:hypothetical protein
MSAAPTRDEVLASIVAKSDQLNADDLIAGPVTVTVTGVRKGDREQPIYVDLKEYPGKSFRPCKTVRRILIASFSDDPKNWIGQRLTIYRDPDVKYGGLAVGGIRISHLSGISEPRVFVLTQTRGKKTEVTILPVKSSGDEKYIADVLSEIAKAETHEMLKAIGFMLKEKSKQIQDAVRSAYAEKQKELDSRSNR